MPTHHDLAGQLAGLWCEDRAASIGARHHRPPRRTPTETFTRTTKFILMMTILLGATACGNTWGERAVTGGAIGAGSGAAVGAVTGIGVLPGALVGGAVGAGVGAATTPER